MKTPKPLTIKIPEYLASETRDGLMRIGNYGAFNSSGNGRRLSDEVQISALIREEAIDTERHLKAAWDCGVEVLGLS